LCGPVWLQIRGHIYCWRPLIPAKREKSMFEFEQLSERPLSAAQGRITADLCDFHHMLWAI